MENYEVIEHTADIGIRVKGNDLKELFKNTALAMFDIIAEKKILPQNSQKIQIKQKAENLEELFVNWLNDLLSLSSAKELIFFDFQIKKIDAHSLEAQVTGANTSFYRVNSEIKAATYHQLKIQNSDTGWQAEVIFDV